MSGLPAFLAHDPGLESGFMTAQIAAAALVADCRVLATPRACNRADGRKPGGCGADGHDRRVEAGRILANAERIVAIELLAGAQGLEYLKPLTPARAVARVYAAVRQVCGGPYGRSTDDGRHREGRKRDS